MKPLRPPLPAVDGIPHTEGWEPPGGAPNGTGWAPWDADTVQDVYNVVSEKLSTQQREIIEAHLSGYNYHDLAVTEKYWRYHYGAAIAKIRKELKL